MSKQGCQGHEGQFKLKRGESREGSPPLGWKDECPVGAQADRDEGLEEPKSPFLNPDPYTRWYGPENLGTVYLEGKKCVALLDTGAQTNAITPELARELDLQILSMSDLVSNRKFGLNGLGGDIHFPQGYVITRVQVEGMRGYDKDNIALVFSDISSFGKRVPFTIGTSTIDRVVHVMTEGEITGMVINWARARGA